MNRHQFACIRLRTLLVNGTWNVGRLDLQNAINVQRISWPQSWCVLVLLFHHSGIVAPLLLGSIGDAPPGKSIRSFAAILPSNIHFGPFVRIIESPGYAAQLFAVVQALFCDRSFVCCYDILTIYCSFLVGLFSVVWVRTAELWDAVWGTRLPQLVLTVRVY